MPTARSPPPPTKSRSAKASFTHGPAITPALSSKPAPALSGSLRMATSATLSSVPANPSASPALDAPLPKASAQKRGSQAFEFEAPPLGVLQPLRPPLHGGQATWSYSTSSHPNNGSKQVRP